jgi:hypothetical protein
MKFISLCLLEPSCDDGNKNQDETDVDCGGSNCTEKCAINKNCSTNADCKNNNCHQSVKQCQGYLVISFLDSLYREYVSFRTILQ